MGFSVLILVTVIDYYYWYIISNQKTIKCPPPPPTSATAWKKERVQHITHTYLRQSKIILCCFLLLSNPLLNQFYNGCKEHWEKLL